MMGKISFKILIFIVCLGFGNTIDVIGNLYLTPNQPKINHSVKNVTFEIQNPKIIENLVNPNTLIDNDENSGLFCAMNTLLDFQNNCADKYQGFNQIWFVLVNNTQYLNDLRNFLKTNSSPNFQIFSIITSFKFDGNGDEFKNILTLSTDADKLKFLSNYSIELTKNLYYMEFQFSLQTPELIGHIVFFIELGILVGMIAFAIFWNHYVYKTFRNDSNQLNKITFFFPLLRSIITIIFTYLMLVEIFNFGTSSEIIERIYGVLYAVYNSVFWVIMMLVAEGFGIHYFNLITSKNLKKKIIIFIIIFIIFFTSDFFNQISIYKVRLIKVSVYILMSLFFLISLYLCYDIVKIYRKIKPKYDFAREYVPEYCDSLGLKISLIRKFFIFCASYPMVFISFNVAFNVELPLVSPLFSLLIIKTIDDIYMFILLFIFRPRVFPRFFEDLMDDKEGAEINMFKIILPKLKFILEANNFGQNINKYKSKFEIKKETPILILNPLFRKSNLNAENVIDTISIGFNQDINP